MKPTTWWSGIAKRLGSAVGLVLLAGCSQVATPPQVVVVGDATPLGKKQPAPDAQHPIYYFPLPVGYKEVGATIAGEPPPPRKDEVCHTLAVALAKQHYLLMNAAHPPEQLLVFWWGSMNPELDDFGSNDPADQIFFNEREMLALVGAYKTEMMPYWQTNDIKSAARDDRYFVIIMAYDFAAARQHQKKLLWMAKMSTPSLGTNLTAVIPALVASGAPAFGQDTVPAVIDSSKAMQEGKVILGPLELKETLPEKKN
jgi:hypothetical protein